MGTSASMKGKKPGKSGKGAAKGYFYDPSNPQSAAKGWQSQRRGGGNKAIHNILRSHDSQLRGLDEWSTWTSKLGKNSKPGKFLMAEKAAHNEAWVAKPHPWNCLIHVPLAFRFILMMLHYLAANPADRQPCQDWVAFRKDLDYAKVETSVQLMIVKQMKGDGKGSDKNGDILIKIRPHHAMLESWTPVLRLWNQLTVTNCGGGGYMAPLLRGHSSGD